MDPPAQCVGREDGQSPPWATAGPNRDPCRGQAGCGQAAALSGCRLRGPPRLGGGQGAHLRFLPPVPVRDTSSLSPHRDGWGRGRHADGVAWGQEPLPAHTSLSSWELVVGVWGRQSRLQWRGVVRDAIGLSLEYLDHRSMQLPPQQQDGGAPIQITIVVLCLSTRQLGRQSIGPWLSHPPATALSPAEPVLLPL